MTLIRRETSVTYPASGDLSSAQYRIVDMDDNGRVRVADTVAGTSYLGVLMNKPAALDRAARVAIGDIVKLEAGAAVNERDAITAVAGGRGSPTTTEDDEIIGYAMTPASGSGVLFEVRLTAPDQFRT